MQEATQVDEIDACVSRSPLSGTVPYVLILPYSVLSANEAHSAQLIKYSYVSLP